MIWQGSEFHGPDFICIGAQRSGTTWLHRLLLSHPNVWVPPVKELHYFDNGHWKRYFKHLAKRRTKGNLGAWDLLYFARLPTDAWYRSLFRQANQRRLVCGELTPAYAILDQKGFRHIHSVNPAVSIMFIMRDPIKRSWSNYVNDWSKEKNNQPIDANRAIAFAKNPPSLKRSLYGNTIRQIETVFAPDKIFYGFTDDIAARPAWFAEQLFGFLRVLPPDKAGVVPGPPIGANGTKYQIPDEFRRALAPMLVDDLKTVADRFGGHARSWLTRMEEFL